MAQWPPSLIRIALECIVKENNYFVVRVSFVGILGSIKISTELIRRVLSALLYWFHILQIFSRRCEGQATLLVSPWPVKVRGSVMGHLHQWKSEPPEGTLQWSKSWDEEDMAANAMFQSPEEIQRLRLSLEKDPKFETSSNWPSLVDWCSTCTSTRLVRLEKEMLEPATDKEEEIVAVCKVEEEDSSCEATAKDACTQTPWRRRRGGRGSRMRRLLAFQLMLSEKKGLPLSRLLSRPDPGSP